MSAAPAVAGPERAPDWLVSSQVAMCPCGCIGKRKKGSFVEKTLDGGANLLRQTVFSEDAAARRGLLQRIDPRVKLLTLIALVVVAALLHSIPGLLALYAATLALAAASALPIGFFLRRVWLFVPIFTGIIVLPATFSFVTSGDIVLTLWHWNGQPVGLTEQGLTSAGLVVSRVATSISLVVLLTLTTPWVRLLAALRSLGVPRVFILIIGMAYRYLFLLLASVTDMYESRKARTVGATAHDKEARRFVAASVGALVGKANVLSEDVYQAMTARGYRGTPRTLERGRLRPLDGAFAAAALVVGAALLWAEGRLEI